MAKQRMDLDAKLDRFAQALAAAAGDNLVSLVLYGSAAAGTAHDSSDVNLVLILRDATADRLRPLGGAFRDWTRQGERPPLVFSLDGWRRAADVFPIEIEDIRRQGRVLRGADPVADLPTSRDDLRRQLEREARGAMVQLRAAYAAAAPDGKALSQLVVASFSTVRVLFRAALRLEDHAKDGDDHAIVAAVAGRAGFPAAALEWAIRHRKADRVPALKPFDPIAAGYLDAVAAFVDFVDRS
jgi:predicted nucleotidyltransferase